MSATDQACNSEKGASGELLVEVRSINAIELVIEVEVGTEHLYRDQVVHSHALALQDLLHALHSKSSFFFCTGRRLAVLGIKADGTGEVKSVSHKHGIAEREGAASGGLVQHHMFAVRISGPGRD